jgi:hypothetical protein
MTKTWAEMTKEIREYLQESKKGGRIENYRITKNSEIHAYGTMPNTNQTGWYLVGKVDDYDIKRQLEYFC